jgi:4-oxalocrotonate tautomerase
VSRGSARPESLGRALPKNQDRRRKSCGFRTWKDQMPLVRIDLVEGKSGEYRRGIADVVYEAMVVVLKVPEDDRFQVITEHPESDLIADANYLGVKRSKDCVFIQITLNDGRSVEQKKEFYCAVANGLHRRLGVRTEDVLINLVEVSKVNWSFGNGEAQYSNL